MNTTQVKVISGRGRLRSVTTCVNMEHAMAKVRVVQITSTMAEKAVAAIAVGAYVMGMEAIGKTVLKTREARDLPTLRAEHKAKVQAFTKIQAVRTHQPWEPWEDELLKSGAASQSVVALKLNRTASSVHNRARRLRGGK